jgi:hypothetical protein
LADKKITQLNNITGADLADADEFVVVDITSDETKAITFNELKTAFDTGTGFVRVTGDTMTGALNVESTITSDGMIVDGDVTFGDNDKAIFGASSDLQIYHDGSHSYVDEQGTGQLRLRGSTQIQFLSGANDYMATMANDGAVTLYYDNASKLATTSTGIDVTGTVTSDGLTSAGNVLVSQSGANSSITINRTDEAPQYNLTMGQSGSSPYITGNDAQVFNINVDPDNTQGSSAFNLNIDGNIALKANAGGDISFYEDTGTTAKFFWDASAESLGLGTSSPSYPLHLSGTGDKVMAVTAGASSVAALNLGNSTNLADGGIRYDNSADALILRASNAERMRIDSLGNVGIGTTSPSTKLDVAGNVSLANYSGTGENKTILAQNSYGQMAAGIRSGITYVGSISPLNFALYTGNSERVRIDTSGNVGIGQTPSATSSYMVALQVGEQANLYGHVDGTGAGSATYLSNNITHNAGEKYINSDSGSLYTQSSGAHKWYNYPSGTAGATATPSEAMRIDSSGNVLVGNTDVSPYTRTSGNAIALGDGLISSAQSGGNAAIFNRMTNDGSIVGFRKDGAPVGSIGRAAHQVY